MKLLGVSARACMMPSPIQPQEYSRSGDAEGVYTFLRNPNGNRNVLYLYLNSSEWNWNYHWLDNDFSDNNPAAVLATHFIPPLSGGVLFCKLPIPTTQHFSNFIKRH